MKKNKIASIDLLFVEPDFSFSFSDPIFRIDLYYGYSECWVKERKLS